MFTTLKNALSTPEVQVKLVQVTTLVVGFTVCVVVNNKIMDGAIFVMNKAIDKINS